RLTAERAVLRGQNEPKDKPRRRQRAGRWRYELTTTRPVTFTGQSGVNWSNRMPVPPAPPRGPPAPPTFSQANTTPPKAEPEGIGRRRCPAEDVCR
uniref:Uncharacterized protein n=1 Tax=Gasterosteus aculeatus TaxID=69293 RepID=G3PPC7_GASAC